MILLIFYFSELIFRTGFYLPSNILFFIFSHRHRPSNIFLCCWCDDCICLVIFYFSELIFRTGFYLSSNILFFSSFHTGTGPLILCPCVKSAYAGFGVDACSIFYKKRKNYKEVMPGTKIHLLIYNPFQAWLCFFIKFS
jgi:hypothetical protein